ncbi:helix-turn-helix domain-containing protein [Paenibacillus sp. YIM B09110]|uniref:helix-turn-helix domain-containing protein n=1 Tax=Paenibacillus sp. YIM B09110 TaxID=3126102 RepID=UPI00301BDF97
MKKLASHELLLFSSIYKRTFLKTEAVRSFDIRMHLLGIVTAGQGKLQDGDTVFSVRQGDLLWLAPGMKAKLTHVSETIQCTLMSFDYVVLTRRKGNWGIGAPVLPSLLPFKLDFVNKQQAYEELAQLDRSYQSKQISIHQLKQQAERAIQSMIASSEDNAARPAAPVNDSIGRSIAYMQEHYKSKIKLETLAQIAGLTPTSYSRSFRRSKGATPVEYLNQLRIDRSKQLLAQADVTVKGACEAVGFGNEFYFSRLFKRTVGISPALYIKRRELKVAVASCYHFQENLRSLGVSCVYAMNGTKYEEHTEAFNRQLVQTQLKELLEAKPDLIIADHRHRFLGELLKQIAPTVYLDFSYDWRINHLRIAELVDREAEARDNFERLEYKAVFARELLFQSIGNETVSLLRLYNWKIRVQGRINHPLNQLLYSELGLKPGSFVPLYERNNEYELNSLPILDSDHLFIHKHKTLPEEEEKFGRLQRTSVWNAIQAVQKKQARLVPNWIGMSWSPVGREKIIDEMLNFNYHSI